MATILTQAVALANKRREQINGDFGVVRQIVEGADLVFAVWNDPGSTYGVGYKIVKGLHRLREIAGDNRLSELRFDAVPCVCAEQAEALFLEIGEKDSRH